jgi:dienelactone hydrolase
MRWQGRALGVVTALMVHDGAAAQSIVREELRIPMAAAGPRGLEALLVRPNTAGKFPLVLLNHGAPRDAKDRPGMTPLTYVPHALEFARRGFTAIVVMRRGYGNSDGVYAESNGPCTNPDFVKSGIASTADLRAAIAHAATRPDVDATRVISVGQSAGGFATVALTAAPPQGLVAAMSFAGGRGSSGPDQVCHDERLVEAVRAYGKTSRVPMLWVYAENDHFFGPALARRMHDAFTDGGGKADFVAAPAYGDDGHNLFSSGGLPIWTPYVDKFLKSQNLTPRTTLLALPSAALKPPASLSESGRGAFADFLRAAPHKAFAVSANGNYGWRSGRRTAEEARSMALETCGRHARDCKIVAVDDVAVR